MDIEKIKILKEAIDLGSLSSVAEKYKYTASGISKMVNSLENQVGFPLLIRNKNGVIPTDECTKLMPSINEIIYWEDQFNQISAEIKGVNIGAISVGTAYGQYYKWLSKLIYEFNRVYPYIEVNIVEGTSSKLSKEVENRKADFCIISKREGNHDWIYLFHDELLAMIPKNHTLSNVDKYPISSFQNDAFIEIYPGLETDNSRVFQHNNIMANKKFSTLDSYAACYLVESNLGVSLVNGLIAKTLTADVLYKSIDPKQIIEIGIAYPKKSIISPAALKFLEFSKKYIYEIKNL